jgi:hypothetical protein
MDIAVENDENCNEENQETEHLPDLVFHSQTLPWLNSKNIIILK